MNIISDIDECKYSPCIHGTCHDQINGYTCSCDNGYEGENCTESEISVYKLCFSKLLSLIVLNHSLV